MSAFARTPKFVLSALVGTSLLAAVPLPASAADKPVEPQLGPAIMAEPVAGTATQFDCLKKAVRTGNANFSLIRSSDGLVLLEQRGSTRFGKWTKMPASDFNDLCRGKRSKTNATLYQGRHVETKVMPGAIKRQGDTVVTTPSSVYARETVYQKLVWTRVNGRAIKVNRSQPAKQLPVQSTDWIKVAETDA